MSYYPVEEKQLFYVEFERGGKKTHFTLFKRNFKHTEEELAELEKQHHQDFPMLKMCNEFHPWNIFTAEYGPDGCVPDRKWIEWMVDALNAYTK